MTNRGKMVILHRRCNHDSSRYFVNIYSSGFPRRFQYLAHSSWKGFSYSTYGWRGRGAYWPSHRLRRLIFRLSLSGIWLESMVVGTYLYNYGYVKLIQLLFPDPRWDIELWAYNHFTSMCSSLAICDRSSTPTIKVWYFFFTWWNYELLSIWLAGTQTAKANDVITSRFPCSESLGSPVSCLLCPPRTKWFVTALWVFSRFPDSFLKSHNSRFFMVQSNGGVICLLAWASASISHPPEKRAVALALINCVSQFGNILGSYVFYLHFQRFKKKKIKLFLWFFSHNLGVLYITYLILSA